MVVFVVVVEIGIISFRFRLSGEHRDDGWYAVAREAISQGDLEVAVPIFGGDVFHLNPSGVKVMGLGVGAEKEQTQDNGDAVNQYETGGFIACHGVHSVNLIMPI